MKSIRIILAACTCAFALPAQDKEPPRVTRPPAELKLADFYKKFVDADGFPIIASAKVPDAALLEARRVVLKMISRRPEILKEMVKHGTRLAVMAKTEVTTDIPEHADLNKAFPKWDWNKRCRGVGATVERPACSAAEENVLAYDDDPYKGESILIHEFAHTMVIMGIDFLEPGFRKDLEAAYKDAMDHQLWKDTYSTTNADEYWAEGVQSWFDANREVKPPNGTHNDVHTRERLKKYDPKLAALIGNVFPDDDWRWNPSAIKAAALDIRPAKDGWDTDAETVKRVLEAAAGELWKYFPDRRLKPVLVEAKGGPITLFQRGTQGEYQIKLATGKTFWAQYTFQFAHEFCHVLCNYREEAHRQKWFEETLCETASLFVLRRSAETWKTNPPFAHWKDYAKHLAEYADQRIQASPLPKDKKLAAWYRENSEALEKRAEDRDRNNIAAVQLLPCFEKTPEHWRAVTWLNTEKLTDSHTFQEYLRAWWCNCPDKHRDFVKDVAKAFGVEIP